MSFDTKLILFFIWVVIAMTISTVGLILIMRWYHREVKKVKSAQQEKQALDNKRIPKK
ncbi:hypothetical protein [Leuconostoc citreum]|jgi:flagellar basal body-associated protein FliL|uniref:Uncharacterized protein n=1 Tax=Leuconostoc citreum TaxID=33964 RepID=A0A5A5U0Z8_LEUCI|nr:hypothetical protein [Leuconostoc citreum]ETJ00154.1 MAG: hypothetical protein Q611_LSC00135G0002 [Leuconostoc sp. DORA_2]MBA5938029.1 hypothetical protein [Leuconostoc citreum]MBE4725375.1 hypothetical protein [Leuconostoc citreum]MBU7450869.1 hypothetical protein [Leuconostoc citreum]MCJ2167588.1 hypothetical protein [Leuconostoc citreum]